MAEPRWTGLLERIALALTLIGFLAREWVCGGAAGPGANLFLQLLFWIALTLWFAGKAFDGGRYRFTGFEFPFLAFAIVALVSVQRASTQLPAAEQAFAWLSLALFFVLAVQILGVRTLLGLLLATLATLSLYGLIQRVVLFPLLQPAAGTVGSIEMAWRIRSNEVFASFLGPNQFAGFLVLLLPLGLGVFLDTRKPLLLPALGFGLASLFLTGSLGGEVALVAGAAAFAGLAATRVKGRAALVAAGAGLVVVAVALLLWGPLLSWSASKSSSMAVREVYWRATKPIVASAPLLGVGLDNWQEHYFQTKPDAPQETRKAHNDYLQVLSETGVVGLLAFASLLGLGLRRGLSRKSARAADPEDPPRGLMAAILAGMLLLGVLQAADAIESALALVLAAAWFGFWLLWSRAPLPAELPWTRIGAASGFIALLVHMMVDFQVEEYGVAAALVAVLALIALLRGDAAEIEMPRGAWIGGAAVLLLVSLPLLLTAAPRLLAADGEIEDARRALAALERGDAANPTALISDALRVARAAQEHAPYNPEAFQLFARAKFHEWDLLRKAGVKDGPTLEAAEVTMLEALDRARALKPRSSAISYEIAQAHRVFRQRRLRSVQNPTMAQAQAMDHLNQALEHQRRAYELYPTFSRNAYALARLQEAARDPQAAKLYEEALRLDALARAERYPLERMQLDPVARARALRGSGRPLEARALLDEQLRRLIAGRPAKEARFRLEAFTRGEEDEMDEGMAPVIKDVVDGILRDLK